MLNDILVKVPADCQKMMFSATFSDEAKEASTKILKEGFHDITVDDKNLVLHGLTQYYINLSEADKLKEVEKLLKLSYTQAVVFVKDVPRAKVLAEYIEGLGIKCKFFVGRMKNDEREALYRQFKKKEFRIVIATEIFQRGVDFEGVNMVIHFDMPKNTDAYLHRSGRAGRFETAGLSVSFVTTDEDKKILEDI